MKKIGSQTDVTTLRPFGVGVVNRDNYEAKAIEFMRMSGRSNGSHPKVTNPLGDKFVSGDRPKWSAWISFFEGAKIPCVAAKQMDSITVPAEWPWEFSEDADYLRPHPGTEMAREVGNEWRE